MPHDPARLLLHLRSALSGRARPEWTVAAWLARLGLPWLVTLAVLLGIPAPATDPLQRGAAEAPPEQLQRAETPAVERATLPGRQLREGYPPQPWPDLPPGWPEWSGRGQALHTAAARPLGVNIPQRLAHWGKRQLEGG